MNEHYFKNVCLFTNLFITLEGGSEMFDSAPDNTALQRVIYQIMWSTFCYRQGSEMTGMGFSHMYENFIHKNGN